MEKSSFTVLITGANSGLGFSICCRLIDEFLYSRPQSQSLHLLFSTRSPRKSAETLTRLNAHLQKTLRKANTHEAPGLSKLIEARFKIEGVQCDLTKLLTVKALAEDLLRRSETLDVVIWNAGIAGWKGRNWPKAIWDVTTKWVEACTYPEYNIADVGLLADRQTQPTTRQEGAKGNAQAVTEDEPKLGQVFLANVFGHYMLTHWLSPLLTADSRIVWVSSVSAIARTFHVDDIQGLKSLTAYEGSKRLTDLLVLTSELPSTQPYLRSFLPASSPTTQSVKDEDRPKMILTHPGVVATSIAGLNFIMTGLMLITFYICRLLGSPWHPVDPYKGSISAVFAALAPPDQLLDYETRDGKGKWGSATSVFGDERVARTEVEGWHFCGLVGKMVAGAISTGNKMGGLLGGSVHRETDQERREQFEVDAITCWREMENLRVEWEKRLGPVRFEESEDS
ncbi:3-keto-steroid reductase [Teratosphaeria nubilosa]|uniref:3-keto-steroid reductase n=1 Tax=Teratosphaeria nubilosa TaxID=161662 RepID=A0A6G1LC44_9PEZI|nr:3-keto-steroid reductase [Teratosphaeria nubilosa]